jgi:hypothetical protein
LNGQQGASLLKLLFQIFNIFSQCTHTYIQYMHTYTNTYYLYALLDGEPTDAIQIVVKTLLASDEERFDYACQKALADAIEDIGAVGLAGVFRLTQGEVTFHVMSKCDVIGKSRGNLSVIHL